MTFAYGIFSEYKNQPHAHYVKRTGATINVLLANELQQLPINTLNTLNGREIAGWHQAQKELAVLQTR